MHRPDIKKVILESALSLMRQHYGDDEKSMTRLMVECGYGAATGTRLRQAETNVGVELIDKMAAKFKLQAWQLLVPGFDAANPPQLASPELMIAGSADEQALLRHFRSFDDEHRAAFLLTHKIPGSAPADNSPPQATPGEAPAGRRKSGERRKYKKAA